MNTIQKDWNFPLLYRARVIIFMAFKMVKMTPKERRFPFSVSGFTNLLEMGCFHWKSFTPSLQDLRNLFHRGGVMLKWIYLSSNPHTPLVLHLEVNKCAFTFSSEKRQIQCTRNEFWCIQCPRPAGPSALDKHQIQASALDLSYFTGKSKCKFINLIHTQQKNKIICSCSWKIINKMVLKCH